MYDAHYILKIIRSFTKNRLVRKFIEDLFPKKYLKNKSDVVLDSRLRPMKHEGLPTYEDILNHPFLQLKKKVGILRKIVPKKTVATDKQKPTAPKVKTASAIRRAKAVLEKEAAKKARQPKRPGTAVAKRRPTAKDHVRVIDLKIAAENRPKTPHPPYPVKNFPTPKVFFNKNGDLK